MNKLIKYTLIIITSFISLLLILYASLYIYNKLIPKIILNNTLNDFEDACYRNNYHKTISMISPNCILYNSVKDNKATTLFNLFNKFEKGFELPIKTLGRIKFDKFKNSEVLGCHIFKIAKKDRKVRVFDFIMIIHEKDKWKILQYGFPDYLNY
jgi:hypothetical protein